MINVPSGTDAMTDYVRQSEQEYHDLLAKYSDAQHEINTLRSALTALWVGVSAEERASWESTAQAMFDSLIEQ
jgi:hypothetical protein